MEVYRTPDSAFDDVPDFPWEPRYAEVTDPDGGTLRMAYVHAGHFLQEDAGAELGQVVADFVLGPRQGQ